MAEADHLAWQMKSLTGQLRDMILITAIRDELRREMLRLVEEIERRHESELTKREQEQLESYQRLLTNKTH